ncbi:MAG: hypothetical protein KGI49_01010 [Patescibacteria group bacterium]|nr:hypothetical protein [Patescibacteria group bacterium]
MNKAGPDKSAWLTTSIAILIVAVSVLSANTASAQNSSASQVQLNDSSFHLVQCDGPELPAGDPYLTSHPGYKPCNFKGIMDQIQFLINVMIILSVVAAIGGAAYAGFLYISGSQDNIKKAKSIFPKLAWGFILMLTAWFIVYQILSWLTGSAGFLSGA